MLVGLKPITISGSKNFLEVLFYIQVLPAFSLECLRNIQIDNNEFLLNELSRVKWQIHKIKNTSQERISTSCSAHCFTVSQSQCDHRAIKS